jgi:hypothetical protein
MDFGCFASPAVRPALIFAVTRRVTIEPGENALRAA